jgi:hypothetical protein
MGQFLFSNVSPRVIIGHSRSEGRSTSSLHLPEMQGIAFAVAEMSIARCPNCKLPIGWRKIKLCRTTLSVRSLLS